MIRRAVSGATAWLSPGVPEELTPDEQGEEPDRHEERQQHPQEEELEEPVRVRQDLRDHAHRPMLAEPAAGTGVVHVRLKGEGVLPDAWGERSPLTESWSSHMNDTKQAVDEAEEAVDAAVPRPGDEHAYEDTWYQVLKQRADDHPDAR